MHKIYFFVGVFMLMILCCDVQGDSDPFSYSSRSYDMPRSRTSSSDNSTQASRENRNYMLFSKQRLAKIRGAAMPGKTLHLALRRINKRCVPLLSGKIRRLSPEDSIEEYLEQNLRKMKQALRLIARSDNSRITTSDSFRDAQSSMHRCIEEMAHRNHLSPSRIRGLEIEKQDYGDSYTQSDAGSNDRRDRYGGGERQERVPYEERWR